MKQKSNIIKKIITLLTSPEAEFVSLVDRGANQTPFSVVKADDITTETKTTMKKNEIAPETIHKFSFAKESFADMSAVTEYMEGHGYEGYTIDDNETEFVVKGVDESAFDEIKPIPANKDGVTVFVGVAKTSVEDATATETVGEVEEVSKCNETSCTEGTETKTEEVKEVTEVVAKDGEESETAEPIFKMGELGAKELVAKYDSWTSCYAATPETPETLADEISAGNDGFPIGYHDVCSAFKNQLRGYVLAGDTAGVKRLCAEYGEILASLTELSTKGGEMVQKALGLVELEDKSSVSKSAEEATEVAEKVVEDPTPSSEEDKLTEAITKALSPIVTQLNTLSNEMQERAAKSESRIASIEQLRVTRKSAANMETPSPQENQTKQKDPLFGNSLGFRR